MKQIVLIVVGSLAVDFEYHLQQFCERHNITVRTMDAIAARLRNAGEVRFEEDGHKVPWADFARSTANIIAEEMPRYSMGSVEAVVMVKPNTNMPDTDKIRFISWLRTHSSYANTSISEVAALAATLQAERRVRIGLNHFRNSKEARFVTPNIVVAVCLAGPFLDVEYSTPADKTSVRELWKLIHAGAYGDREQAVQACKLLVETLPGFYTACG